MESDEDDFFVPKVEDNYDFPENIENSEGLVKFEIDDELFDGSVKFEINDGDCAAGYENINGDTKLGSDP